MDRQEYNAIVRWISRLSFPVNNEELVFRNVDRNTLGSIACHEYVRHTKRTIYQHNKPHIIAKYYKQFMDSLSAGEPAGVLLRMASRLQVAPALLAKFVLNCYANDTDGEYRELADRGKRQRLAQLVREPDGLRDPRVSAEVRLCVLSDNGYGPMAEMIKLTVGLEYELRLKKQLTLMGVPFLDEEDLRRRGQDKTPDVLLDVPIAVSGCVVNWIESKASFGDDETHEGYMRDQYEKYWNRFGPGMVIYWFGFIEDLLPAASARHVLLQDHLPEELVEFMEPELGVTPVDAAGADSDLQMGPLFDSDDSD
ncbi:CDAN1-interacting nuclease 1-like [Amphibalanus amphitrite]|uniref:CDAN1-interacting nuclease 1-like n=1 Tax=Amphibalanus amphitrite TaxID=1232801 RepID=UPI001C90990E|nr:CDAN1-interacting nuclease 1-like [Amphibalanus amphitrite]XP_043224009.1 CDAN1-interacting nuclease 1-like [Amphibalanus amphitrite]XP_043224010.1 CDAN1-interacting nuclease 1-like [Amphibalanus amphitrite]XP_043224011.1 CDAN1-interacting nuclease 1-like [Amphibalanus amphitrite]XP_043224012.1 CDAN1-interacting nuclease 1-like [Amphibalanus amphitrite]XP_043224013.1 CDAN1-interacting nuclease 1-like [Amphibalanus amphitrite]XP_043224014.1 CDAN1-interacting nuclease 1-like [Amphibalanus am